MAWSMSFLEDKFGESVATLSPEKACRLYMTVCQLKDLSEDTVNCQWTEVSHLTHLFTIYL